ncbi:MAG: single-stranded-DNA-specific exonuclease RecJ, partial [Burkholderiales bacterium]|nr:single-stranded-DNA-specific exonuclease RecJ [Anaerolineae bacterium]
QTSTALLVSALRELGAEVEYHIPNRFREGHGIHLDTLKTLIAGGIDLLLTCDTGISAHDSIDYAQNRGVDVIITDHHTLPENLPDAFAVVNPMRLAERHPLRELPGVGTAYMLMKALYGTRSSDHLLDLVAMGIVADVMVQVDDTRYLLQRGLDVLRNSPRPGLKALMQRAEIDPADLTESDIGFTLAPRLNALGRLADANPAIDLLTTDDTAIITERVNELEGLNQKRRFLTRQVYEAAQQKILDDPSLLKYAALVIAGEGWHTGVVGIVASRLVEDYGCPVILLSENDGVANGSARSVAGINIVEAIRTQAHMLDHFGGHNMAAGLSLAADKVFELRRGISLFARDVLGKTAVEPQLQIDAYVMLSEIDLAFAEDISRLAPFGNGNPPLTLATKNVHVKSRRTLGSRGDHLDLRIEDADGNEQRVLWWFGDMDAVPQGRFDIAFTVRPNVFNGKREALIEWLDVRAVEGQSLDLGEGKPNYTLLDYRRQPDAESLLQQVQREHDDVLIWREGIANMDGVDRHHLRQAQTFVVWQPPPSPIIWQSALNTVQPQTLVLFGQVPPFDQADALLKQLAGLVKYALKHKGGTVNVSDLAALTGHAEQTISAGLHWLNSETTLRLTPLTEDLYEISEADTAEKQPNAAKRLELLLSETKAYRRFWMQHSPS